MDNKEYRENQKEQRKSFKKYRKHMWKFILSACIAVIPFVFQGTFRFIYDVLVKHLTEYVAGSIVYWSQLLCLGGGIIGGIVHAIKANDSKNEIEKAQDKEEEIVDSLINEKDELLEKIENLEKQKTKALEEIKTTTKSMNNAIKNNSTYTEEKEKVKRRVR